MTSITTFAYGLTVQGTGLITASRAWPSLEPIFQFIDLVQLRKRRGTLRTRARSGCMERAPLEVWQEIRNYLVKMELEDTETAILGEFIDSCPDDRCDCGMTGKMTWERINPYAERPDGEEAIDIWGSMEFCDFVEGFTHGTGEALEPIHRLLASFGLAHPLTRFISCLPYLSDFNSVAFIALPARTSSGHSVINAGAGADQYMDEHTLVDVDLSLPSDADSRFSRFIRMFNLTVMQVSHSTLRISKPSWKARRGPKRGVHERVERRGEKGLQMDKIKVVNEIKPSFKLYTSCWVEYEEEVEESEEDESNEE